MQFRELEYVLAIARTHSIGKAANELNVSQPTISKFVQNIEGLLGQPLFTKSGNKLFLTYAGERYVSTAKTIMDLKNQLDREMSDIKNENIGEIKVAFRMCGGLNILPSIAQDFWSRYPNVNISVLEDSSHGIEEILLNGNVDIAFITLANKIDGITYEKICTEEILLAMAENNPLAKLAESKPACKFPWMDLRHVADENFILQQTGHKTRDAAERLFSFYGIKPNIRLAVSNIDMELQLASEGLGMTFSGEFPLSQVHTTHPLACFSVGEPKTEFDFAVAYRNGMYISSVMRNFIDTSKEVLQKSVAK